MGGQSEAVLITLLHPLPCSDRGSNENSIVQTVWSLRRGSHANTEKINGKIKTQVYRNHQGTLVTVLKRGGEDKREEEEERREEKKKREGERERRLE